MIGKTDPAARDGGPAVAGVSPPSHRATGRRWADVLAHRWPTVVGIAVAALAAFDLGDGTEFAALTALMPLVYLGAAALDRRGFAWVVLLAGVTLMIFTPSIAGFDHSMVFLAAAPVFLIVGVARGQLRIPGGLPLQTAGMLGFGALVLVALSVDAGLGGKLVAIALFGHGVWDAAHYLRDRVVARSYAEFCGILDLLLGVTILVLA